MSKAFISILGTNDYLECKHKFNGIETDIPVKYCQEDLIKIFCSDFNKEDEIRIFLTKDAESKNWLNDGHLDRKTNQPITNTGLKERLEKIVDPIIIKPIRIKEGFNEDEIWEIFQTIFDSINAEEELIVDITHAFRTLPMLMITLLNFAKQVKRIKVKGIYYAAFETLGPISEVKFSPPDKRIAPILDLKSFTDLQDWTNVTYDFINNANVSDLKKISKSVNSKVDKSLEKKNILSVLTELNNISENITLCRGKWIRNHDFTRTKENILRLKEVNSELKPINALVDKLCQKIEFFNNDSINNLIQSVNWSYNHGFYQQAITLLQETIITLILDKLRYDSEERSYRQVVSKAFYLYNKKYFNENSWDSLCQKHNDLTRKLLNYDFLADISNDYEYLSEIRNDINHGGFQSDSKSCDSIKSRLKNSSDNILPKLSKYFSM